MWIVLVFLPISLLIDLPEQQAAGSPYVLFHADYSAWNRTGSVGGKFKSSAPWLLS